MAALLLLELYERSKIILNLFHSYGPLPKSWKILCHGPHGRCVPLFDTLIIMYYTHPYVQWLYNKIKVLLDGFHEAARGFGNVDSRSINGLDHLRVISKFLLSNVSKIKIGEIPKLKPNLYTKCSDGSQFGGPWELWAHNLMEKYS